MHVSTPQVLCFFGVIRHEFWHKKTTVMIEKERINTIGVTLSKRNPPLISSL